MRTLPRPTDPCGTTYLTCASRVRGEVKKAALVAAQPHVVASDVSYQTRASAATLHVFPRASGVVSVPDADFKDLYNQLTSKKSPGRAIYDRLLNAPDHGMCPLCGAQPAKTLDHHLPRAHYPIIAVAPLNLVPACRDCQTAKREVYPTVAEEQSLHPYFDRPQLVRWLSAEVVANGIRPAVRFSVVPPDNWTLLEINRHSRHLKLFDLQVRFSQFAGAELVTMKARLTRLHTAGGAAEVKRHLAETAESHRAVWINSWQTATYDACASSDWFCQTGFSFAGA